MAWINLYTIFWGTWILLGYNIFEVKNQMSIKKIYVSLSAIVLSSLCRLGLEDAHL